MSVTPETDALRETIDSGGGVEAEMLEHARKLEYERNEAREALREIAELVQRDGAWDTPNDISGSLVTIDDICEEAAK